MKKAHEQALERIYVSEINDALDRASAGLPFQSNAKVYDELEREGLVRRVCVRVGRGWSACTVTGWVLTLAGNLAYCMTCTDEPEA